MLSKIFRNKKSNHISSSIPALPSKTPVGPGDKQSRALKIVHAGGHVDRYYMATPATRIIQKHPSFLLARPEIFRRPWDSVVRPKEILVPGQKYYLVPRPTVKKLRRRIRKPSATGPGHNLSGSISGRSRSFSGILVKPGIKVKSIDRHVMFLDLETANKKGSLVTVPNPSSKRSGSKLGEWSKERSAIPKMEEKKRRARIEFAWEPSLQSINE